jgi:hypothetical protein
MKTKNFFKLFLYAATSLAIAFVFTSCGEKEEPGKENGTEKTDPKKPSNPTDPGSNTGEPTIELVDISTITINSAFQFAFVIDGKQYHHVTYVGSSVSTPMSSAPNITDWNTNNRLFTYVSSIESTKDLFNFYIAKGQLNSMLPSDAQFLSFFGIGSHTYSLEGYGEDNINGIVIMWEDADGKLWSTNKPTYNSLVVPDQSNSTFEITDRKEVPYSEIAFSDLCMKIRAVFSCTLYDEQGNSKKLENGVYVGYVVNER